jgi:GNAT superfamily N-acetyltransferase
MLMKLVPTDEAIGEGSAFLADEVQYNLIHRISEGTDAFCLKSPDGKMIFTQTPGHNGWLWIAKDVTLLKELVRELKGEGFPGITSEPETAEAFSNVFCEANGGRFEPFMTMEAYHCPKVIKPANIKGVIVKATEQHSDTVAQFLSGFMEDAFEVSVDPSTQQGKARSMIEGEGLYLWMVEGKPVSMANIAHRAPRHARINGVYTPPENRKKGYASALVAEICTILEGENLIPMLYADLKNPTSNKIYQNIGFEKKGHILVLKYIPHEV